MRFRKRPVEVEAMQFTNDTKNEVFNWCRHIQQNIQPSIDSEGKPILIVPTLEGDMICSIGDYLIKEPLPNDWRKFYPRKPDIFEATHDKVNE